MLTLNLQASPNWHLFFCLPYDNDLEVHSGFITDQISKFIRSDEVEVTFLIQHPGGEISCTHQWMDEGHGFFTPHLEMTSGKALGEFLAWSEECIPEKRRKGFFMLGHGGGVNKMALEESRDSSWMSTTTFARTLEAYTEQHGKFDVLFLQQCVKATTSEFFELSGVARWIAASPLPIGAPNFYYESVLTALSRGKLKKPRQLIEACIHADRPDMSEVWSVIHADRFAHWLRYLNEHPPSWSSRNLEDGVSKAYDPKYQGTLGEIQYAGEQYWDLQAWLSMMRGRGYFSATDYGELRSGLMRATETIDRRLLWIKRGQAPASPSGIPLAVDLSGVVIRQGTADASMRFAQELPDLLPFLQPIEDWP